MNLDGRQKSPALSAAASLGPGHMFNASEIGTLPRGTLPRGMSPGPGAVRKIKKRKKNLF